MDKPVIEQSRPFKVAIFAGNPLCVSTINMLLQQQQLAGVILPEQTSVFSEQLQAWLQQMTIPYTKFVPEQSELVLEKLIRWETEVAINFAVESSLLEQYAEIPTYGLYHCHCSVFSAAQGEMPLYWQVCEQDKHTKITLQKSNVSAEAPMIIHDIAATHIIDIDPLDTLQCLENKIAAQMAPVLHEFFQKVHRQQGNIQLAVALDPAPTTPVIQEQDLKVDWTNMSSEQICALARAGNPQMGGSVITLANSALNLLQATPIKYATYGVPAGTICHTGEPDGVVVATIDSAIRLDILSSADGLFSGVVFCERFKISAGMAFSNKLIE